MDASTITATTTSQIAGQRATTKGYDDISSEDFFALMIAELQSQDPLNPKDNQQLLQQMANIRQMEQSATLTKTLESLAQEQRFGTTAGLIGHYIAGRVQDSGGNSTEIRGLVIGVRFEGSGNAILELHNGKFIPASSVEQVTLIENLPPDVLEQLEAELAGNLPPPDEDDDAGETGGDGVTPDEAPQPDARSIQADAARAAAASRVRAALDSARQSGKAPPRRDIVSELLHGLVSPGVGLQLGI